MAAVSDLDTLLASMRPVLSDDAFVFVCLPEARYGDEAQLRPVAAMREDEGLTLVLSQARADAAGLSDDATFHRLTLQVHSSLNAVGLTAAVATALAERGISANVVAAYYHDHVFVPSERAREALETLEQLAASADTAAHAEPPIRD